VNQVNAPRLPVVSRLLDSLQAVGPVVDLRIGTHWTAVVVETRGGLRAGLAATQLPETEGPARSVIDIASRLIGRMGIELAGFARSESPIERSVGFAAMNALLDIPARACVERNAEELILRMGTEKCVAIIGHFPFVDEIRRGAKECWVLELHPGPEDVSATRAPELLPRADVVAVTGMALVNQTFDGLASLWRPDAYVLVLGPSTPLSPILFDYGVDALSGTLVEDIPAVLEGVSQGATFRQLSGKRLVTIELVHWRTLQGVPPSGEGVGLGGGLA
jgi:uncharacterized protein (DUF4213/DUF364 family)